MKKSKNWTKAYSLAKRHFKAFLVIYLGLYFFSSFVFWFYNVNSSYENNKKPLERYVQNHKDELKKIVFQKIYSEAERCNTPVAESLRQKCYGDIRHQLALVVKEEEFLNEKGYGWPHDLFFVKQKDNSFYRLGWEGKLEDISPYTNKTFPNKKPYPLKVLTRNCREFEATLHYLPSCQIYVSLDLSSVEKGYVVRRIPLTEEHNLFWIVLMLPFAVLSIFITLAKWNFTDILIPLAYILVPALVTILLIIIYTKIIKYKQPQK